METWAEIREWRKTQRPAMIERRLGAARDVRAQWNGTITERIVGELPTSEWTCVGFYWPFKGEFDPRPLVRRLGEDGVRFALPAVVEKKAPLVFREWWPGARMEPGIWNIPVPAEGAEVVPDTLLVPLLGFDDNGYRLGYGGGYYDRTFAKFIGLGRKPFAVGIGFELSRLETIHPQPHDIPMDVIVTERRIEAFGRRPATRR